MEQYRTSKTGINQFSKDDSRLLKQNFFLVYIKYIIFLEKPYIGKLKNTNNKIENYFRNTLDKHAKRIYRTSEGIFDYIIVRKNGGMENQKKSPNKLTEP